MKLRRLMALTTAAIMAASLTACGGQKAETNTQAADSRKESAAAGEQITLRMAWWGSQTRHDATNKVIEMYILRRSFTILTATSQSWTPWWQQMMYGISSRWAETSRNI